MDPEKVLRPKETAAMIGLSLRQLWLIEKRGEFVPRIQLAKRAVGFSLRDVLAWLDSKKAA